MRWSETHGTKALLAIAGLLLAFAVGADLILSDEPPLPRSGSDRALELQPADDQLARFESPGLPEHSRLESSRRSRVGYVEFRCTEPVSLRLSDGTRYEPRYAAVIPIRAGAESALLEGPRGLRRHVLYVGAGETARLPCP